MLVTVNKHKDERNSRLGKTAMWVSETNINLTAALQQLRHIKARLTK
jgi:hypothetical protein